MSDQNHLEELLKIYRGNAEHLEKQIAMHGGPDLAPVPIKNQYESNLVAFRAVQAQLTHFISGRSNQFLSSVVESAQQLQAEDNRVDINRLANDDRVVTVLTQAGQIAVRNHQKEKLEALRNAVLNSLLSADFEEELELLFLTIIDQLTPLQIQIVKFLDAPHWEGRDGIWKEQYQEILQLQKLSSNSGYRDTMIANIFNEYPIETRLSLFDLLINTFPFLREQKKFCEITFMNLALLGIIKTNTALEKRTPPLLMQPFTTELGKQLLAYIASPLKSREKA